jgi:superfamily I DNA and RNA helicase
MATIWWTKKEQLDKDQIALIERLPLRESFLILGPPGSGKTNVLLRRAQFVRGQNMPNVLVLTFTRPLTEFVKTGCFDAQGREIFPPSCVTTLESWQRMLYAHHRTALPSGGGSLTDWKRQLAAGAMGFRAQGKIPQYDALFIDEAQDLLAEEVALIAQWSPVIFFVGDDQQKIFEDTEGLAAVRQVVPTTHERILQFHYRVAPEICQVADRILLPPNGTSLASTAHYSGPKPATVTFQPQPLTKDRQLEITAARLQEQIRVYGDLIRQGDRLGVVVARRDDRQVVFNYLESIPALTGKSKIIRAKEDKADNYDPSFDSDAPICILTVKGCKGLEFRAVHWLFADELGHHHKPEHYYTVVTRAKTSLDVCYTYALPQTLARAHSETGVTEW